MISHIAVRISRNTSLSQMNNDKSFLTVIDRHILIHIKGFSVGLPFNGSTEVNLYTLIAFNGNKSSTIE